MPGGGARAGIGRAGPLGRYEQVDDACARPQLPAIAQPAAAARPSGPMPAASGARPKTTKRVAFRKVTLATDPDYIPPAASKSKGLLSRRQIRQRPGPLRLCQWAITREVCQLYLAVLIV